MRIAVVTRSISRLAGGLFFSVRDLCKALHSLGLDVDVHAADDPYAARDLVEWAPLQPHVHGVIGPSSFAFSPGIRASLVAGDYEMIHSHGLWQDPSRSAGIGRQSKKIPWLISPRGMLDPWALAHSRWKKRLVAAWFEHRNLHGAACLHALCQSEADSIRLYGLRNPICIIPNGVEVPEKAESEQRRAENGKKTLLFLGRLHAKKGLINAIKAWGQVLHSKSNIENPKSNDWQFVIAGWDQGGHQAELKALATELGIQWTDVRDQVAESADFKFPVSDGELFFTGPVFGEAKRALLRSADAFILPSFSEGLPMSVLEAWAYNLPVLMTDHCNLPEGFAAEAARRIDTDVDSIAEGLRQLFGSPLSDLRSLGQNGRALVERRFTWPQVANQMKAVYEWVLGGGRVPDCLRQY